jgi:FkbM family methyltransferase
MKYKIMKHNLKNFVLLFLFLLSTPPSVLFKIIKKSREPLPKISTRVSKNGKFSGFHNDYMTLAIQDKGSMEPHFHEITNVLINRNDIILDVGANIGTHSVILARKAKLGRVYAFEPQSVAFSILQNNIIYNQLSNVIALHYAISALDNHTVSMDNFSFVGGGGIINNGSLRLSNFKNDNVIGEVSLSRTIDSFNFKSVNFIKMDIQGSEVMALSGAKKTIKKSRPIIFIEIEDIHLEALGYSSKELEAKIRSFQYAIYRINVNPFYDHLCVPIEEVSTFEKRIKNKFSFTMTKI